MIMSLIIMNNKIIEHGKLCESYKCVKVANAILDLMKVLKKELHSFVVPMFNECRP